MPNHLDFLLVLDDKLRHSSLGYIPSNVELATLAIDSGLSTASNNRAPNWTGELVELRLVSHRPLALGDQQRPLPPGTMWNDSDVSRVRDFRVTADGMAAADLVRRRDRETRTDLALGIGAAGPTTLREDHQRALATQVRVLRDGLDSERWTDAIGAAKDLVEAAAKVRIEHAGGAVNKPDGLVAVVKQALPDAETDEGTAVARSLAGAVQRLAELRNVAGAGHGHASVDRATAQAAYLAASAACALARFVLAAD